MDLNYEADVKIEESALDVEWLQQPTLALKYGRHAAHMRKLANLADQRVKVVAAELTRAVAEDPRSHTGKEKPTVGEVEAYVRTHPDHQAAKEAWIEADYEATYAETAHKEISFTRKQALENLVTLHGQNYFAGPSIPRDLSREWEKRSHQRKADAHVASALKRRRTV